MPSPTIVLAHGAFGDASSWRPVFDRLAGDGHTVLAPPNPLRGIPYDASFTASVTDQHDGPVVLVGHSYGGAVITVAGGSDKIAGLVCDGEPNIKVIYHGEISGRMAAESR